MSTPVSKKRNWQRTAGLTGTALVLGGMFTTAPTIAASPDSSFGFIQSAHAAEVPVTITSIEVDENNLQNTNNKLESTETLGLPEAETPVVEEEKPADPVVVTKTEEKPAPVDPNTGEGASAKFIATSADIATEDDSNSMGLIIGGLGFGAVLAIGGVVFAWRKGLIRKLADAPLNRK